uniref:Mitochondrial inner membrane protease subunit, putative n=1 Tax=Arundo donax TaxID=35708 RepID=A0A0A9GS34_ARUDO
MGGSPTSSGRPQGLAKWRERCLKGEFHLFDNSFTRKTCLVTINQIAGW